MLMADVVELFVVDALTDSLKPRELLHAWTSVSDQVLRLHKPPRRLDLVWLEAPPNAQLVKQDYELVRLALKTPRRLVVVPIADAVAEAMRAYRDYMNVAWKSQRRAQEARARKGTTPRSRGRRRLKLIEG
jgi:hypothetical protein